VKLLIGAAPANTDASTYVDVLDGVGVSYSTEAAAIDLGNTICDSFRGGAKFIDVVLAISQNSPYSNYEAGEIIGASAMEPCPDQYPNGQAQASQFEVTR
jgi:hypothetical protein